MTRPPLPRRKLAVRLYLADFMLLNLSFFISIHIKRNKLVLTMQYAELLFILNVCWIISCAVAK